MEEFKIKVLSGDELYDLILDLLQTALDMPLDRDIRPLVRLAQILYKAEEIEA